MSIKNKTTLKAQIDSEFPDNITGEISPLDLRSQSKDEVDSALNLADTALQTVVGPVNFTFGNLQIDSLPVQASGIQFIRVESDFAVQDATTITLEAGKFYFLAAPLTTAKRFIVQNNATITSGAQSTSNVLTYTGTGTMFTMTDVNFTFTAFRYSCPNGKGFEIVDTVGGVQTGYINESLCESCVDAGSADNMGVLVINRSSFTGGDGITLSGANFGIFSVTRSGINVTGTGGKAIDLGSAVFNTLLEFGNNFFVGGATEFGISGLASNGNIPAGLQAMVTGCEFLGGIAPLENITTSDIRWIFKDNVGLADSRVDADVYLTGGSETITVAVAGDWNEIGVPSSGGVSWASDLAERFTIGTDGVITYIGEKDVNVVVNGRATVEKVGGGSNILEVRIAKNWSGLVSDSGLAKSRAQTQNTDPTTVPIGALVTLSQNDNIRAIFSNTNGNADIIASVSALEVHE